MSPFSSFIKNPENMYYEGEDDNEKILYVLRRSQITNLGWSLILLSMLAAPIFVGIFAASFMVKLENFLGPVFFGLLLVWWYVAVFGFGFFQFLNWYFNVYIISSKKIVDFDFYGLTYKNISDTPIANIQDVSAKISGPFNMIFNVGDVFIQTSAEHSEFDFEDVNNPGIIRDIISDMISEEKSK